MFRYIKYTVVVLLIMWLAGFFVYVHKMPKELTSELEQTDAIVVLTGGQGRISTGVSLLYKNKSDKLFISGVDSGTDVDMIVAAIDTQTESKNDKHRFRDYLVNRVMMRRRIYLGYEAKDTIDNALETALWVQKKDVKSIRLVTSAYHMLRAMLYFKDVPKKIWEANKEVFQKEDNKTKEKEIVGIAYGKLHEIKIIPHPVFNKDIKYDEWWTDYNTIRIFVIEYNKYILSVMFQSLMSIVRF